MEVNFLIVKDEPGTIENFNSSVSTSSSLTIISPDQFDVVSISDIDTNKKLVEASALLSLLTENSASVSGDELETATSSDIEIIASPQSGLRKNLDLVDSTANCKTHCRELSEASSDDSTSSSLDTEKMARKISELNQLLEVSIFICKINENTIFFWYLWNLQQVFIRKWILKNKYKNQIKKKIILIKIWF